MVADILYRQRDWVALAPAAALIVLLMSFSLQQLAKLKTDEATPMTVTLLEEEPTPPDLPPPPPRVMQPLPPEPRVPPRPVLREPTPISEPVTPPPPEAPPSPAPPKAAPVAPPPPVETQPAPPPVAPTLAAAYVGRLRAYLNSIKRYPTSREARLQRPQGRVEIWLDLARDGTLREAGIGQTSGSMILDGAALSTVRQGNYPAFPPEAWAQRQSHRFTVTLEYVLEAAS